ncbi:ThiF family adenylyltransferase [Streptomyces sp. NPDC050617]|uniref:ThiF family adenylyltransferase n=1 Tax=Streptomyces sp. NPDC050617 TaxID=3154628 RepID=UPI00344AB8D2
MHPMIKPALRRGWRNRDTVQFGVAPAHAVVLGPVDTATGSFLDLLDGTRGLPLLRAQAKAMGLPEGRADSLVERLAAAGLLDDPLGGGEPAAALRDTGPALDRLRPDLASLSVLHPEPGGALRLLGARRATRVQVRGAGRVGAMIAALLSASGVGQVDVLEGGCVEPWDTVPGGVRAEQIGERRDAAARRVVRQSAPEPRPRARPREDAPPGRAGVSDGADQPPLSLVVIAPRDGLAAYAPDPAVAEPFVASGTPHLYAGVIECTGVVGPLVLPGGSACAGCLELGRAERDPTWPRMLAQWRSGRAVGAPSCDAALATVVSGLAAVQALAFLDGRPPDSAGSRLEVALPGAGWAPRRIAPHPACSCGAAGSAHPECASASKPLHGTMVG